MSIQPIKLRYVVHSILLSQYHDGLTPRVQRLNPLAMSAANGVDLLQIYGRIFTNEFQEDLNIPNQEYFKRILVGGRACNAMDENGTL